MTITIDDLKNQIGKEGPRPILYCPDCKEQYSANAEDYFTNEDNKELMCSCGASLVLVIKRIVFDIVKE